MDRIWRGGIAIEMEGDRGGIAIEMEGDRDRGGIAIEMEWDRIWRGGIVSMKLKNIHDSSKSAHEIQSRNEVYDLNTIDLS